MITSARKRLRIGVLTLSAGMTLLLVACLGDSISQIGKGGGIANSPGACATGPLNSAWTNTRLSGNRTLPVKCPYKVDVVGQSIALAAEVFGPKATTSINGFGTLGPVRSTLAFFSVAPSVSAYWQDDQNNVDGRRMTFYTNYQAGYYPAGGPGPWSHDSGTVTVDNTTYGQAQAYITLSGRADAAPGYIVVPSAIVAGNAALFRAVTSVDTSAYAFSWSVDGASVANDDARLLTALATPGSHQLTAYATNAAGGVETMAATFNVELNVTFNGNRSAKPGYAVTYSAVIGAGGTAPYSYQWLLNGAQVGSGASYQYTFGSSCSAQLQLNTTDAGGHAGSSVSTLYLIDPTC